MLALVKKPRIELSLQGEGAAELIAWISRKYEVIVLSPPEPGDAVPVEETEFWREMEKNRVGNLLAAARLKAGLTQAQLARKLAIRQNMVSDYEHGNRRLSDQMAGRFSAALRVKESQLKYKAGPRRGKATKAKK